MIIWIGKNLIWLLLGIFLYNHVPLWSTEMWVWAGIFTVLSIFQAWSYENYKI